MTGLATEDSSSSRDRSRGKSGSRHLGSSDDGKSKPNVLVTDPSNQDRPRISPNGRWVAYESNERGGYRIYVTSFRASGRKFEVSVPAVGGTQPIWSRSGKELFYLSPDNALMAIDVIDPDTTIAFGPLETIVFRTSVTDGLVLRC